MGLMDLFNQGDMREKLYSAASRNNVPQGGVTGAMFKGMFPHGLGNLAFGRNPETMPPLETPEGTALMADLASNMMVPGTFIGPKGLARLFGDDAAKGMLATAESKLAQGVPKEAVFQELGVFKGPEGKWRYEIDDSGASFVKHTREPSFEDYRATQQAQALLDSVPKFKSANEMRTFYDSQPGLYEKVQAARGTVAKYDSMLNPAPQKRTLDQFLDHDMAFRAYPDTADVKATYDPRKIGGAYQPNMNGMDIGGGQELSTTLHELQHAVQEREGFAAGGAPEWNIDGPSFWPPFTPPHDVVEAAEKLLELQRVHGIAPADSAAKYRGAFKLDDEFMNQAIDLVTSGDLPRVQSEVAKYRGKPFDIYQRLAGEAEARAVQDRMNMSMDERRALFPEYAGRNDLIVRGLMSGGK